MSSIRSRAAATWRGLTSAATLAIGLLAADSAAAQAGNVFGATIRNPGGIAPEWWNEAAYIPERMEGALLLRMGAAGNFQGAPFLGRPTCDLAMLYAAKSGVPLPRDEMEQCAIWEFEIHRGVTGDSRSLGDSFARRDILAEFTASIERRIDLFRKNDLYYLRAAAVALEPFDIAQGGMAMRLNWTQNAFLANPAIGRPETVYYKFDDPHFRKSDDRFWGVRLMADEADGRGMEQARVANKWLTASNYFVFEVLGTREARQGSSSIDRFVKVRVKHFAISYVSSDGRTVTMGFVQ